MFRGFCGKLMLLLVVVVFLASAGGRAAEAQQDMGGWEKDSPYNGYYNAAEMDQLRGVVERIFEVTPLPGMKPGVGLTVRESKDDDPITVHLCPVWFAKPGSIGLKKGDRVKIKGVWAEIDGEDVFMASKVKKGDYFQFKVRLTKDGTPFWTMSAEELAKELASN